MCKAEKPATGQRTGYVYVRTSSPDPSTRVRWWTTPLWLDQDTRAQMWCRRATLLCFICVARVPFCRRERMNTCAQSQFERLRRPCPAAWSYDACDLSASDYAARVCSKPSVNICSRHAAVANRGRVCASEESSIELQALLHPNPTPMSRLTVEHMCEGYSCSLGSAC